MVAFAFIAVLVATVLILGVPAVTFALMLETCRERTLGTASMSSAASAVDTHGGAHGFEAAVA